MTVVQTATLTGTVEQFDAAAQTSYKRGLVQAVNAKLATGTPPLTESQVTLLVRSASIVVTATIAMLAPTDGGAAVDQNAIAASVNTALAQVSASELSSAAGVQVEALAPPLTQETERLPPNTQGGGGGLGIGALVGIIAGGVVGVALLVVIVYCIFRQRRTRSVKVVDASYTPSAAAQSSKR